MFPQNKTTMDRDSDRKIDIWSEISGRKDPSRSCHAHCRIGPIASEYPGCNRPVACSIRKE